MTIKFAINTEADNLLKDGEFQEKWRTLYENCPWATPFQSVGYVTTWYEIYRDRFTPVILYQISADEDLTGLLTLAMSADSRHLVFAGAHQAEYQVWLADPQYGNSFIENALKELRLHFSNHSLVFKYLPSSAPIDWTSSSQPYGQFCKFDTYSRPLMTLTDGDQLSTPLRSKNLKKQIRRLNNQGKVCSEQVKDVGELASVLDEFVVFYDCRQAAISGVCPFREDLLKKPFHLALMKIPDLLHVTVLKVDDKIAAVHVGLTIRNMVIPILLGHSPFYARCSPGTIQIFLLGQELAEHGFSVLDLTPGNDSWKERFTTDCDECYILSVFSNRRHLIQLETSQKVITLAKRALQLFGVTPQSLKAFLVRLRRVEIFHLFLELFKRLWDRTELRVYVINAEETIQRKHSQIMSKDQLEELMAFQPTEARQTLQNFMSRSLWRLERGCHVYTYVKHGQLLHYGWMIELPETFFFQEVEQEFCFPPGSVFLFDFYTHPKAIERNLSQLSLTQMLHDVKTLPTTKQVYVAVLANDTQLQQAVEEVGFAYEGSLFKSVTFGQVKHWSSEQYAQAETQEEKKVRS